MEERITIMRKPKSWPAICGFLVEEIKPQAYAHLPKKGVISRNVPRAIALNRSFHTSPAIRRLPATQPKPDQAAGQH